MLIAPIICAGGAQIGGRMQREIIVRDSVEFGIEGDLHVNRASGGKREAMYGSREFFASDTLARFIARAVHTLTLDRPPASSFAHIEIMGFCDPGTLGRECSFPAIAIICERNEQFKKPAIRLTAISIHKSACRSEEHTSELQSLMRI